MKPLFLCSLAMFVTASTARAEPIGLSLEDFKMYRQYLNAMEDPRVQKMKPEARLPAIAKDAGYKLPELKKAIARGQAEGDVQAKCQKNMVESLNSGGFSGRLGRTEIDASVPHAIAYVEWMNENPTQLEEEASLVASLAAASCPILSTLQLWAQDKANPKMRVFQGLIPKPSADKINRERTKDFADTRYIRLFEKVKNIAAGDDFSVDAGAAN
jgi:hypothetical protein